MFSTVHFHHDWKKLLDYWYIFSHTAFVILFLVFPLPFFLQLFMIIFNVFLDIDEIHACSTCTCSYLNLPSFQILFYNEKCKSLDLINGTLCVGNQNWACI